LLNNAIKFSSEGYIEFGYTTKDHFIEFYVKDTGIGISPEYQTQIFERFIQADLSISKRYGGTGLGLSISKSFTQLLGGEINVFSELGKGSLFTFTIPIKTANFNNTISNYTINDIIIGKSVLIAEDEEFNYLLIHQLLSDLQVNILHARDGNQAIEMCKIHPEIDLILMDIKMPNIDGVDSLKEIRKLRPNIPVIAQTAYALENEKEAFLKTGFNDYIAKPFKKDELIQKVYRLIK
jgi:CheY-like chemotaxis protein